MSQDDPWVRSDCSGGGTSNVDNDWPIDEHTMRHKTAGVYHTFLLLPSGGSSTNRVFRGSASPLVKLLPVQPQLVTTRELAIACRASGLLPLPMTMRWCGCTAKRLSAFEARPRVKHISVIPVQM